ncbi:Ig-like domain-containing protein [Promicromonospora sp. NPDC057138]|uniref:Ig-like domain-containing protein n=1 Tax=Promicromonospora sp. NPDC057138 TaxID=3346031 RepID=UPI00363F71CD
MRSRRSIRISAGAAALAVVAVTGVAGPVVAAVPTVPDPVTYEAYPAVTDPGNTSPTYFQPYWYDTGGRHVQAHGGQIVTGTAEELGVDADEAVAVQEGGTTVYYWYGEDRSNGYYESPGVSLYTSTDTYNWTNQGVVMRSVTSREELQSEYFDAVYDTVADDGTPRTAVIDDLFYYLNVKSTTPTGEPQLTAIFERPKVLHNAQTGKWVMWWHSDGSITPGGSTYARSMAAVAVADSPTGPFKLDGAYRLYNEPTYKTACNQNSAVPGGARDMTVFQDDDGAAYISYSSEENRSLYIAKLNAEYTNVEKTTATDTVGIQYSADGQYPRIFADGTAGAPVAGQDYSIVRRCGLLEAPALFVHDGKYYAVTSGATGWRPNAQTYYTAGSILGSWIRGVQPDDQYESVAYDTIPEGGDGLLSYGDTRRTSFGSQATNVFPLDAAEGKFVYMGDRWNSGAADSTYVWLPLTFGEGGRLEMRNPAAQDARWASGWTDAYWDDKGAGQYVWRVTDDRLPDTVRTNDDLTQVLPSTVAVTANGVTTDVPVTWSPTALGTAGKQTLTGTLAGDADFTPGRTFRRTVDVIAHGVHNFAPTAKVTASSRQDLAATTIDGSLGKGWDDWVGGGKYPLSSTLDYSWPEPRAPHEIAVHLYKDGPTATWPSRIAVQYQDASGAWKDSGVAADVAQDAAGPAPVVRLDTTSVPPTTAVRLRLTTATSTWQSVAEVEILGLAPAPGTELASLSVDGEPVDGFDPAVWDQTVLATSATPVLAGTASDPAATVTVDQATAERPWAFVVVTAAEDGKPVAERIYRVKVLHPEGDARLAGLAVDGVPVAGFAADTLGYGVDTGPWGAVPDVTADPVQDGAAVDVAADQVSARVTVTSPDGSTTRTYTVKFTSTGCADPSVGAPWAAAAWGARPASFCQGDGSSFRISDAGDGAWTTKDNLTVVSQPDRLPVGGSVQTYAAAMDRGPNGDPRSGLIVRNDLSTAGKGTSDGYVTLVASPSGAYLQWDANGNGYLDSQSSAVAAATWPVYLRLERTTDTTMTGYYRTSADKPWTVVGTAPLTSADARLDAGVVATANNAQGTSVATMLSTRFWDEPDAADAVHVGTVAETAPVLPGTVGVTLVGGDRITAPVTWEPIDPLAYAEAGTFTVAGSVGGTGLTARATVTVAPRPVHAVVGQETTFTAGGFDPGEVVHVTLMPRDKAGKALTPVPLDDVTASDGGTVTPGFVLSGVRVGTHDLVLRGTDSGTELRLKLVLVRAEDML